MSAAEVWWRFVYSHWSPVERQHLYRLAAAGGWVLRAP